MIDDLRLREQTKYEKMWARKEYHIYSPGEKIQTNALDIMSPDTLYDFGCGTGRAVQKFISEGYQATGLDFVDVTDGKIPFKKICLWDDLSDLKIVKYGYCTDVMEHIPPEKVDDVIKNIASLVSDGCFFQIALRPDTMGKLINETLHVSINTVQWWLDTLNEHFSECDIIQADGGTLMGYFKK